MARDHAHPDYMRPSPGEIATLARGRYSRSRQGNQGRTWRPSKARTAAVRVVVFTRDLFTCQLCGTQRLPKCDPADYAGEAIYGLHLDHITPYRDGGLFYPGNLRALCESCNCRRGAP